MIIGITGLIGSGKGAVAEILMKRGFVELGHSSIISEELKKLGREVNRDNQVSLGNEMRQKEGPGFWARKLILKIEPGKNYVVEGFRNVAEVDEFRKLKDFYFVGVAAGFKRRFEWVMKRQRIGDPKNIEEFEKIEKRDFLQALQHGQQNALCFSMADYYVSNEGTLEELNKEVNRMLESHGLS